jgi:MoxR-like ATPase
MTTNIYDQKNDPKQSEATYSADAIKEMSNRFQGLSGEIAKVIVGQQEVINFILMGILCEGHILLEGVPGIAKTTMIKAMTKALGLKFNRIQFTPDLLPADLIGTLIYNPKTQEFETRKGPIFANLILADEINRAPAKVQSALLEAMQEHQITIGLESFKLDEPFLVFATQNPIEQEGTYRLPEAQVDRFMFKLLVHYPTVYEEREIVKRPLDVNVIQQFLEKDDVLKAQHMVSQVYIDDRIIDYIVNIVFATREPSKNNLKEIGHFIQYGVSPRATIALYKAAKSCAFLKRRNFVTPDDVKQVCPAVLRHRLLLTYEAEADNIMPDAIIQKILSVVPTP